MTKEYLVGVWVGNADGEGRPGLTGVQSAAPILFDLFDLLPSGTWFQEPIAWLDEVSVCKQSGMRPGMFCTETETIQVPKSGFNTLPCPYHQQIHLDQDKKNRVHADCYPVQLMKDTSWFILPPGIAWFYQQRNPLYTNPPPWAPDCAPKSGWSPMEILSPHLPDQIMIPRELNKQLGRMLVEATHIQASSIIHWYLDDSYIGSTQHIHKMSFQPEPGKHRLTLMDDGGNILEENFEVLSKIKTKNNKTREHAPLLNNKNNTKQNTKKTKQKMLTC
jgi:penicillin-binding protein 1C